MISIDYPPTPGGISAHVYELSQAFKNSGHRVNIVTRLRDDSPAKTVEDGMTIHRVKLQYSVLFYGLQIRNFVKKLLPEIQPDIIHIHGMNPLEWYNISHIPLAYTNHTSGYLKRIQKGGWRRMTMLKRYFHRPDLFLAPSKELLHVPFDIPAVMRYIPNGVDASKFSFNTEKRLEIRNALGIQLDETVAIVTRRLVDKNGVIFLAKATEFLKNLKLRFILIGDGPERKAVEDEFTKHCGKRATFLGNKTHKDIVEYYSAADFSILPSLMEATSISGLEAMAARLPLVGTEVGGIPELIHNGVNGYLCKPADPRDLAGKITLLLESDITTFGKNSRKIVEENYDWEQIAEKTLTAYKTVLR